MAQYTAPTMPAPPTILPSVTGTRLWITPASVMEEASKPAGTCPVSTSSQASGRKYMLATQCSKPAATKAEIGKITATIVGHRPSRIGEPDRRAHQHVAQESLD